jgi:peptidoglycan/xylan/chitin deacetylase (PgdA/CDA1 family)
MPGGSPRRYLPGGPGGTDVPPVVLMYHSVAACDADPFRVTVSPAQFARQMRLLHRLGIRGVSVRELLGHTGSAGSAGPGPRIGLTFDDGYQDFLTGALPVLTRYGFTATVFVVAGGLGGDNHWDHPVGPRKLLLTPQQVREVAEAGMEVGAHGLQHVRLPSLPGPRLRREVERSGQHLAQLTGREVAGFCYPYGEAGARELAAVRAAGYGYACIGPPTRLTSRYALPRIYVGDRDGPVRLAAKWARDRLGCYRRYPERRSGTRPAEEGVGVR